MNYLSNVLSLFTVFVLLFGSSMLYSAPEIIAEFGLSQDEGMRLIALSVIIASIVLGGVFAYGLSYSPIVKKILEREHPNASLPKNLQPLNLWKNPMIWLKTIAIVGGAWIVSQMIVYLLTLLPLSELLLMGLALIISFALPTFALSKWVGAKWFAQQIQ